MGLSVVAALLVFAIPFGARAANDDEPAVTVEQSAAESTRAPERPPSEQPTAPAVPPLPPPTPAPVQVPAPAGVRAVETSARPRWSAGFELGYARGGDAFVSLPRPGMPGVLGTIDAGEGLFASLAGSWALSRRDSYDLGVYAAAGVKYADIGNDSTGVSFTRFPVMAAAQILAPVSDRWFMLGRAGLLTEVGAKMTGRGLAAGESTQFATRPGAFVDAGACVALARHSCVALLLRYTYLDLSYAGSVTSANSLAASAGVYFAR